MNIFSTENFLRFQCQNHGTCCRNWDILLSKETVENLKISLPLLKEVNDHPDFAEEVNPNNHIFNAHAKIINGSCLFLRPGNTCAIFQEWGKEKGNPLCLTYPFIKLKLQGRYTITTAMSCLHEADELFSDNSLQEVTLSPEQSRDFFFSVPFDHLENINFSKDLKISWPAYYYLEKHLLSRASDPSCTFPDIEQTMNMIHKSLQKLQNKIINEEIIAELLKNNSFNGSSYSEDVSFSKILFFIRRKINLYHFPPFMSEMEDLLKSCPEQICEAEEILAFNEVWQKFDTPLKRLFIMKFYSSQTNFLHSVQFFWHLLFFYFRFLKLFIFFRWKYEKKIDNEMLKKAVFFTEKYFFHDHQLFNLWGHGKRGAKDFHQTSLEQLFC